MIKPPVLKEHDEAAEDKVGGLSHHHTEESAASVKSKKEWEEEEALKEENLDNDSEQDERKPAYDFMKDFFDDDFNVFRGKYKEYRMKFSQ